MDSIMTENNTFLELMLHLRTLTNQHSLLVGGCVRDLRLGRQPKDLDIVTDANLDEVSKVLSENGWSIDEAGKQFFVLIASKNGQQFEIALFRKDGTYTDGRRPDFVQVGTMEEDALRRDFTINSLYLDPWTGEFYDPTGKGFKDIEDKIIRFNGKPKDRITEDLLRIMRCYRFSAVLGFEIESKALKICRTYFNEMCSKISGERIRLEVEKMI